MMVRGVAVGMLLVLAVASYGLIGPSSTVGLTDRPAPVSLERLEEGGLVPVEVDFSAVEDVCESARLEEGASISAQVIFLGS